MCKDLCGRLKRFLQAGGSAGIVLMYTLLCIFHRLLATDEVQWCDYANAHAVQHHLAHHFGSFKLYS